MKNYISVDEIENGMVVAEPIANKFGNVLLSTGSVLNHSHITLLKTWNVKTISIKGNDNDNEDVITAELREKAAVGLAKRMKWYPRNDIEKDLYNLGITVAAMNLLDISKEKENGHSKNTHSGS
jgi:hypothetical protein